MIAQWTSPVGRHFRVIVPDHSSPDTWSRGIVVGPPDLDGLGLSEEVTTRLHNELFNRGIFTHADANARRQEVQSALMFAMRVDAQRIIDEFRENGN